MTTTSPHQIDLWRAARSEDQHLEFKEAKNQYDFIKLCRYCVALGNEGGGKLLFGIEDTPPRRVVGSQACDNPVGMAEKLFEKLGFRVDVEVVAHPDGRVVVFHVPSRPRGTAWDLDGSYLMRSGEEVVSMTEDRLRRIFGEGAPDWLEQQVEGEYTGEQVLHILHTRAFFELMTWPWPSTAAAVLDRLLAERLIDAIGDDLFAIRRMGALLLAHRLRDFDGLARRSMRVVVYQGKSKVETKLEHTGVKGLAVGFQGLVAFIIEQLPQNEVIENALRTSVKLVPDIVVRELVANALIHQDFNVSGASPMVEIYQDRVEFSNPGEPIVPVARFIDGYQSRNERLADLTRRMRICEEKGSGIDKVIQSIEVFQLPPPDFRVGHQRTSVVVFGPQAFESMTRADRVRACYQHCCLKWAMNDQMSNQSLRERFGLPESKAAIASQIISATVEANLVKSYEGAGTSRRFARYLPVWA
jgi:ATP-dependent DNA helicase RecG